jgi:hypothetical protein
VALMNKKQLFIKVEKTWMAFKESYAGLSDERLLQPGVTEDWSVKDILAHIRTWEEEALKYLPYILRDEKPPRYSVLYGGIDAFNAQMTELKRGLSLSEVREQLDATHLELLAYIQDVPEEQFTSETRFRRRLRLDTYSHYPIHAQAIRAWRERST